MKITLLQIGKTDKNYVTDGVSDFEKRLKHYVNYSTITIPSVRLSKKTSSHIIKQKESELLLDCFSKADYIILLDEKGKKLTSSLFAEFLQKRMNSGIRNLFFVVGGAYGFSENVKKKADCLISLSDMTFSHQLVRLVFSEQLYRAMTILRNEPYHND